MKDTTTKEAQSASQHLGNKDYNDRSFENNTDICATTPQSMVFYRDWYNAIRELPQEMRATAYEALFDFAFAGIEPHDPILCAIISLMIAAIRRDRVKYNQKVERMNRNRQAAQQRRKNTVPASDNPKIPSKSQQQPVSAITTTDANDVLQPITEDQQRDAVLKAQFEEFRNKYPHNKRGFAVEFDNLCRHHSDKWREIIPCLLPGLEREMAHRQKVRANNGFLPNLPSLSRWINESRWQTEYPDVESSATKTTQPTGNLGGYASRTEYWNELSEHEDRVADLRAEYRRRVPRAFTQNAPLTFSQYCIDHCSEMTDDELNRYLLAVNA